MTVPFERAHRNSAIPPSSTPLLLLPLTGIGEVQTLAHYVPHLGVIPVAETADFTLPSVKSPFHRRLRVGVHPGGVDADGPHPFYQCVFLGRLFVLGRRLDAVDDVLVEPCPSRDIVAGEFAQGLLPKLLSGLA